MIRWKTLDTLATDEIAALLKKRGIKGIQKNSRLCPLAHATGDAVGSDVRIHDGKSYPLTKAEMLFVCRFDRGLFPELEEK